jgi:O-antigen/teichoic acid export membrane protein
MCNGFMNIPYMTQLAHGWTGFAVHVNIVAVSVIIPAILWAVPRFGTIGAAWVWLGLNAGYVLVGMHFMHRKLLPGEKWRWYRDAIFKPLVVGSITVLVLRQWIILPENRLLMAAALTGIGLSMMAVVLWSVPTSRKVLQYQFKSNHFED